MAKAPKPTTAEIAEYLKLEEERRTLESKARTIARRTKALHDHFRSHLEDRGKSSLKISDYRLTLIDGSARVAWKDEFIKLSGPLKAEELMQAAPRSKKVEVQKA